MDNISRLVNVNYVRHEIVYDTNNNPVLNGDDTPFYGSYYVAYMPEVAIGATGSSHVAAVTNLMTKVNAAPNPAQNPISWNRTS